jgi:hypothetical protein
MGGIQVTNKRVNTLSDKSDSFFGEPAYWPPCTQQARSGLGLSVEKHLTAKSTLILGSFTHGACRGTAYFSNTR